MERQQMRSTGSEESRRLIDAHRAWTARAFCMATAELRGSFEPDRSATPPALSAARGGRKTATPGFLRRVLIPRF